MKKTLLLFIIFPLKLFCQDITGLWVGAMYNDTTRNFIPYEIFINSDNGKYTGYSRTTFSIDGIENIGVKSLKIIQRKNKVFLEDISLLYNNYSLPPAKGVHQYSLMDYSEKENKLILNGLWNTNRTREFKPVTGTIHLEKQKAKDSSDKLITKLEELGLMRGHDLSHLPKKPETAKISVALNIRTPPIPVGPAADVAKRKIETIETVFFNSDSLVLTLYDNGEVDGDTVTILMNGKVIWPRQGLTANGVNKTLMIPKGTDSIQLIMYAENLGSIPPNTGLLVVRDSGRDYEIRFSGDLQRNAAILLRRQRKK